jgi:hypothetical protein
VGLGAVFENHVLDAILGAGYTTVADVYVALFTATPTAAGGGTEVSGGAYARVTVANNATNWPAAASGSKSNGTIITFPTATAAWGTVTSFALFDAATAGNLICFGNLSASVAVASGQTPEFAVGALTCTAS